MSRSDTALLAAVRDAHAAGRVSVEVIFSAVNRAGAPGFRTTDVVVPWFFSAVVSVYLAITSGVVAGIALFIVLAGLIVVVLRPLNRARAEERNRQMGLADVQHWETLWRMGGLALRDRAGRTCISPEDDWREFARSLDAED